MTRFRFSAFVLVILSASLGGCSFLNQTSAGDNSRANLESFCEEAINKGERTNRPQPEAPIILGTRPEQAWVRPSFKGPDGRFGAGTAFVVSQDNAVFLLTAHHLFGPAGGLDREYGWSEMPKLVSGASGENPLGKVSVITGKALPVKGARGMKGTQVNADLAIFPVQSESQVHAMPLAQTLPQVGDDVWLVGEVIGSSEYRHKAVVDQVSKEGIYYRFDNKIELRATSGAPIVDAKGQVVAMNLGGGEYQGAIMGIGNPAPVMNCHLQAAWR
ncbi:serine protease [Acaryochloris sp. CCMEE 5410]|uniref:S1 family peptidase n=1 Tax=Acaryochloris sp. CCMEE 5410 TaxID=310037 RepID=UPI00024849EB|nr:serine protease [Acaryochloris sp. CCMEE 5410]KAI9132618.1 trypsin-like peptidase domain-containing protein [Acaryochloris sp. CCMEE 5410]